MFFDCLIGVNREQHEICKDVIGDRDFGGKVLHSVTQVVFEILFGSDVASNDVVLVAAPCIKVFFAGFCTSI
jgi:hypothetical protein